SHHLLDEDGIGHLIQRDKDTGERRDDPKIEGEGCHGRCPAAGAGWSRLPERGNTRKAVAFQPSRKCSVVLVTFPPCAGTFILARAKTVLLFTSCLHRDRRWGGNPL